MTDFILPTSLSEYGLIIRLINRSYYNAIITDCPTEGNKLRFEVELPIGLWDWFRILMLWDLLHLSHNYAHKHTENFHLLTK
jgi:hypothetical protein